MGDFARRASQLAGVLSLTFIIGALESVKSFEQNMYAQRPCKVTSEYGGRSLSLDLLIRKNMKNIFSTYNMSMNRVYPARGCL